MKAENKIQIATKIPVAKDRHIIRPSQVKAVKMAWTPQPNPLTREEIRRMVIDQIG